jgi:hypothetical protein
VNSRRVLFVEQAELMRELRGLERRRGSSGRDRVDHRAGSHDDLANSAAGALVLALASMARHAPAVLVNAEVPPTTRGVGYAPHEYVEAPGTGWNLYGLSSKRPKW